MIVTAFVGCCVCLSGCIGLALIALADRWPITSCRARCRIIPKTSHLPGITAPVEIVRNNANVPHIFGQTDADVYFALGFAHAQDRLWQMTMLRRTAQGRLSEVFGERTLKIDELMRRFDLYDLSLANR